MGDILHDALQKVGITKDRVEKWLGRPCGCRERHKKLNDIHRWAARFLAGYEVPETATEKLLGIIGPEVEEKQPPSPNTEEQSNGGSQVDRDHR
jgi:hypothetical protein